MGPVTLSQETCEVMQKHLSVNEHECGFLFDENYSLKACVERIDKCYSLKENHGNWLALSVFCDKVFSYVELLEYQRQGEDGFSLYKRTAYLAEMVGKRAFLQTMEKILHLFPASTKAAV